VKEGYFLEDRREVELTVDVYSKNGSKVEFKRGIIIYVRTSENNHS